MHHGKAEHRRLCAIQVADVNKDPAHTYVVEYVKSVIRINKEFAKIIRPRP